MTLPICPHGLFTRWCDACLPPRPVTYCPRCAEAWPERLEAARREGTAIAVLCSRHLAELRERAAIRVEVIA